MTKERIEQCFIKSFYRFKKDMKYLLIISGLTIVSLLAVILITNIATIILFIISLIINLFSIKVFISKNY